MRFQSDDDDNVEVQMTPMIDCVFLLLIFFLVATVLKKPENELDVELPESAAAIEVVEQPQTLVLGITKEGDYYIEGNPVGLDMLHARLRQVAEKDPTNPIRIDSDRDTKMQDVVHVLDICKFERLKNVSIRTRGNKDDKKSKKKRKKGK